VFVGTWLSGWFIVSTNAFMQHPVGYAVREDGTMRGAARRSFSTVGGSDTRTQGAVDGLHGRGSSREGKRVAARKLQVHAGYGKRQSSVSHGVGFFPWVVFVATTASHRTRESGDAHPMRAHALNATHCNWASCQAITATGEQLRMPQFVRAFASKRKTVAHSFLLPKPLPLVGDGMCCASPHLRAPAVPLPRGMKESRS